MRSKREALVRPLTNSNLTTSTPPTIVPDVYRGKSNDGFVGFSIRISTMKNNKKKGNHFVVLFNLERANYKTLYAQIS